MATMGMDAEHKQDALQLAIAIMGIFALLFAVILFNRYVLMGLPLAIRAVLLILLQWVPAIVPIAMIVTAKDHLTDLGFARGRMASQIGIGLAIAAAMSLLLTVIPILAGLKDWVGQTFYTQPWQFAFEFVYRILGVAFAEELIFRGFIYSRLLKMGDSVLFAILVSSALFGLFHIFGGNIVQVIMTAFIGVFWCLCREKIKNCTTLSLIIAHGVYDALIVLWCAVL